MHSLRSRSGLSLFGVLINAAIVGVVIAGGLLLLFHERAQTRDALRLADMAKLRMGFELMYFEKNGFQDAAVGCGTVGAPAATCALAAYLPDVATLRDPGKYRYEVVAVPNADDYSVAFTLERKRGSLAPGKHVLTHAGIR